MFDKKDDNTNSTTDVFRPAKGSAKVVIGHGVVINGEIKKADEVQIDGEADVTMKTDNLVVGATGDNLAATFSPELVDLTIYMIDVAQGADIPRKKAPAIRKSDLLVINKVDLAPYVNVDLDQMKEDVNEARNGLPYIFGEMKNNNGIEKISDFLITQGGL